MVGGVAFVSAAALLYEIVSTGGGKDGVGIDTDAVEHLIQFNII